jgi:Arc/MetJ family transcription regulator
VHPVQPVTVRLKGRLYDGTGTTTKRATVNAALQAAVDREKRREFADWLKAGGLPDLTGSTATSESDVA